MSTKDELRDLANDCTGLFSTFVPKQILRDAADELDTKQSRIDQLEKELKKASETLSYAAEHAGLLHQLLLKRKVSNL